MNAMVKILTTLGLEEHISDASLVNHNNFMMLYNRGEDEKILREILKGQKKNYRATKLLRYIHPPLKYNAKVLKEMIDVEANLLRRYKQSKEL